MYHISLITLAPFCILGGEVIWMALTTVWGKLKHAKPATRTNTRINDRRYPAFITLAVLIPYFLLTSGLVYEITRQDITDSYDTPYSIALSSYRLDLAGVFCHQDGLAANWLSQHSDGTTSVVTDQHTHRIIQFHRFFGPVGGISLDDGSRTTSSYIYLTKWNVEKDELAFAMYPGLKKANAGLRKHFSPENIPGLNEVISRKDLVYNNGGARILAPIDVEIVIR